MREKGHRGRGEDDSCPGGCLDTGEGRHGGSPETNPPTLVGVENPSSRDAGRVFRVYVRTLWYLCVDNSGLAGVRVAGKKITTHRQKWPILRLGGQIITSYQHP